MPLPIRLGLDNYAHARTVDTRPFFFGQVGPGNEANFTFSAFVGIYVCASTLITCAIITSRTLLPCDLASVDFRRLLFLATMSSLAQLRVRDGYREAEAT